MTSPRSRSPSGCRRRRSGASSTRARRPIASVLAMELREAMRCAPTSRLFSDEPIDVDVLKGVFDDARFAPSGGNRQGWRVVVVRDPERRRALRDLYLPPWRAYMEQTGGARMLSSPGDFDPARVR